MAALQRKDPRRIKKGTNRKYEALLAEGTRCFHQEAWDRAARAYRNAFLLSPDRAEAYYYLGTVLLKLGRPDEAVDRYLDAMERCTPWRPWSATSTPWSVGSESWARATAAAFNLLMLVEFAEEDKPEWWNDAGLLALSARVVRAAPYLVDAHRMRADALLGLLPRWKVGPRSVAQLVEAATHYEWAAALHHTQTAQDSYATLAELCHDKAYSALVVEGQLLQLGLGLEDDNRRVVLHWLEAIALWPNRPQAYFTLGVALNNSARYVEAAQRYVEAMERFQVGSVGWALATAEAFSMLTHELTQEDFDAEVAQLDWWNDQALKKLSETVVTVVADHLAAHDMRAHVLSGQWYPNPNQEARPRSEAELKEAAMHFGQAAALCMATQSKHQPFFAGRAEQCRSLAYAQSDEVVFGMLDDLIDVSF